MENRCKIIKGTKTTGHVLWSVVLLLLLESPRLEGGQRQASLDTHAIEPRSIHRVPPLIGPLILIEISRT